MTTELKAHEAPADYMVGTQRVRPEYKQTEVGVIPEDWDAVSMKDITTHIGDGLHGTPIYSPNGEYYFINGNNLNGGKIVVSNDTKSVEYSEFIKHRKPLGNRSILLSINGTIGNLGLFEGEPVVLGKSAAYLNVKPEFCKQFVYHSLQTQIVRQQFLDSLTGSTIGNLGLAAVRQTQIPLPSTKAEQEVIAAALSDVDALLAKLDQLIAKKRDLKQAAMQQLLTGSTRLPGFSGEWSPIKMAKHASLKARIGWQALTTAEYLDEGSYYLVTGTDFIDGRVNWLSCHFVDQWRYDQDRNIQLRDGDVLLTKDGTIGKVGYVDSLRGPATLNSGVFVIRPLQEAFAPLFLFYILRSKVFDEFLSMITAGSTIVHLYQKDFVTFEFLAPSLKEQIAIATILSDMDAEIAALEARRDKTCDLKQGMMQELLTGRIRLV